MNNKYLTGDFLKRQIALVEELNGQSDRGVAIVGAAWVEESIQEALHAIMVRDDKCWKRLFGPNGPLSMFSAKIDMARLLGCISDVIRSDLHTIREIRNEFAHQIAHKSTSEKLQFGSPYILDKCFSLKCVAHEDPSSAKEAFVRACAILNADFELLRMFGSSVGQDSQIKAKIEDAA